MVQDRSYLEWKVNLPFIWINGAARDDFMKENLVHAVVRRNDAKMRLSS